ncbi:MAG TPA: 2-hydroxyacid dehydrogenase [Candidatus Angelobacter sp.]|jgi:phosphoglycerate dehydrogenase-like enzyme|nr:2-hydroxyacid dehydrogenase [Candidatus Angelobacter sp.]
MPPVTGAVIWVPSGADPAHLRLLPEDVAVREIPDDAIPEHPGRGDMVIPHVRRSRLRELLDRLDGLRVVQTMSAGIDAYRGLVPPGVTLCDARGVHDVPVAEWTVAAILAMQRDLPRYVRNQANSEWRPEQRPAREVCGMEVVIVGHGSIGRAVAQRLTAFGATVTGVARHPREDARGMDELPALLPKADAVVILLPLTDATRGLFGEQHIALMKPGALLVNAGRGAVADTRAITDAVQQGRIRVALDVVDPEPLPADHLLWREEHALLTPHVAGSSDAFLGRAWRLVADQVRRYVDGEPLHNVVSPADGY